MNDLNSIKEEIKNRNDIYDVVSNYVNLKKTGSSRYSGLCPFHNEKTPSFFVDVDKQIYHCFGCNKGGDIISFIQEYEKCTFFEALKILAERVNLLDELEKTISQNKNNYDKFKSVTNDKLKIREINEEALKYFSKLLNENKDAIEYLKKRSINEDIIKNFEIGYADSNEYSLYNFLKRKQYDENLLIKSGLFFKTKFGLKDKFNSRIIFPIKDEIGRAIGFGGRIIKDIEDVPKYLNSPETEVFNKRNILYCLNIAKNSRKDNIILCEGYMDVIALHKIGYNQAVASMGTSLTEEQAKLIKRYVNNVYILYDSDKAGIDATIRAISILKKFNIVTKVIKLNEYKDPDEFIKNKKAEEFEKAFEKAEDGFVFIVNNILKKYDLKNAEEEIKFLNEVIEQIKQSRDELERNVYMEYIVRTYSVSRKYIEQQLKPIEKNDSKDNIIINKDNKALSDIKKDEELIISLFLNYKDYRNIIKNNLTIDDFSDDLCKKLINIMYNKIECNTNDFSKLFFNDNDLQEYKSKISEIFFIIEKKEKDEFNEIKLKNIIKNLIINIKTHSINRKYLKNGRKLSLQETVNMKQEILKIKNINID